MMREGHRVHGAGPGEDPAPEPGHDYVELVGGPLDGQLVDVTGGRRRSAARARL